MRIEEAAHSYYATGLPKLEVVVASIQQSLLGVTA